MNNIETILEEMYELIDPKEVHISIDWIYDTLYGLAADDNFEAIDSIMEAVDFSKISIDVVLAILITTRVFPKLKLRRPFYEKSLEFVRNIDPSEIEEDFNLYEYVSKFE